MRTGNVESPQKQLTNIWSILQSAPVRQIAFMVGVAVSVALGIVLYMSIQEPTYQPLDYQVSSQNMGAIASTLEKAGIQYKLNDKDGVILVAAKDYQLARLKLSAAGIPKDNGFNYSFLNDQNNLTSSQFMENARYLRALENDLAKTISGIEGISGAVVHIAIPQNNIFADENNKVTASVVINVSPTVISNKEIARSIVKIVSDSVPGLDPKNVSITDQYGHLLSDGMDANSVFNAAQLNYQNSIQNYYEKRIESMLMPLIGQDKVNVRVNANLDFTQQEDALEEYDPDKKAVLSEEDDSEEDDSSGASGVPGSLANSPESSGASGNSSGSGRKSTKSMKNYNTSKTITYKKSNFAKVKSLSVAVVVDNEMVLDPKTNKMVNKPVPAELVNKITDLVKATIGYDQARGDKVIVVNSSFSDKKMVVPTITSHLWDTPWFWDMIKKTLGIILGFVFLFVLYRRLSNHLNSIKLHAPVVNQKSYFEPDPEDKSDNSILRMHELKDQGMSRLKEMANTEPNKIAMIIKSWMK
ncbi:MAG: flagellar basal-body MS-ring/collar protein FliF [Gammaproteobacteria bacterium]